MSHLTELCGVETKKHLAAILEYFHTLISLSQLSGHNAPYLENSLDFIHYLFNNKDHIFLLFLRYNVGSERAEIDVVLRYGIVLQLVNQIKEATKAHMHAPLACNIQTFIYLSIQSSSSESFVKAAKVFFFLPAAAVPLVEAVLSCENLNNI